MCPLFYSNIFLLVINILNYIQKFYNINTFKRQFSFYEVKIDTPTSITKNFKKADSL